MIQTQNLKNTGNCELMYLLLVKVAVRADLVSNTNTLHVDDLSSGKLVCVLNRTLSNLLIANSVVNSVLDSSITLRLRIKFISLVSVLISP